MKKIETAGEKEKREARNRLIIGIILVGIMVLSTAGYAFFSNERTNGSTNNGESLDYNGLIFEKGNDGYWHTAIQGYNFSFSFNPKETENISGYIFLKLNSYANKPLYFSSGSNALGIGEITRNIGNFVERVQYVCVSNCSEDLPVKNCSDNIISIEDSNETSIKQEENCSYILARYDDVLKASDKFIFKILGIN
jgi:hypothetical protein